MSCRRATSDTTAPGANDFATIRPCSRYSTVAGDRRHCEFRRALEARKRQLYGRPYMRTDAINWFAFSELCRSLQDGGKTPLTTEACSPHARFRAPAVFRWSCIGRKGKHKR